MPVEKCPNSSAFSPSELNPAICIFGHLPLNLPFLLLPLFPVLTACIFPASGYIHTPGSQRLHWILPPVHLQTAFLLFLLPDLKLSALCFDFNLSLGLGLGLWFLLGPFGTETLFLSSP